MTSNWQEVELDSLKSDAKNAFAMGPFGSNIKAENFTDRGVPVIKGANLGGNFLLEEDFDYLTQEKANQLAASKARRLDLVITHRGTLGQVGLIPETSRFEEYVVSQSQLKMSFNRELVDPYFVYYFLRSPIGQNRLLANTSQVGVPAIAQALTTLRKIKVPLPELNVQIAITRFLRMIDERIKLLDEANASFDAIAQAVYKSWFVNFEPVRLKSQGKSTGIESEQIAALFPTSFEESALGLIPAGWSVVPFLDACDLQGGSQPPASTFIEEEKDGYVRLLQIRDFSTDAHKTYIPDTNKLRKVEEDDVLLGRYGSASGDKKKDSLGRVCRGLSGAYNVALMKLSPQLVGREFCCQLVSDPKFYSYLQGVSSKAVQSGFSKKELANYKVVIPTSEISNEFEIIGNAFWANVKANNARRKTLISLRDTLLPRLISGQLRIADAEAELEKVTA